MLIEKAGHLRHLPRGCAVEVTLEGGRLVKVEPRGSSLRKFMSGAGTPEIVYSPHRLKTLLSAPVSAEKGNSVQLRDEALTGGAKCKDKENTAPRPC